MNSSERDSQIKETENLVKCTYCDQLGSTKQYGQQPQKQSQ